MATASEINFEDTLSLEKAFLFSRKINNHLGTDELVLNYNIQTDNAKELSMEWLYENRIELTDPTFSFKTYEGTWKLIDITYNEKTNVIQQRFKIDAPFEDDIAARDNGGIVYKSYYWRIADPSDYNIPVYTTTGTSTPSLDGAYWYDSHTNENGEMVLYDDTEVYQKWYTGSEYRIGKISDGFTTTDYFSSSTIDGDYTANGTYTGTLTVGFDDEFVWTKTANDNGDGTYDVVITKGQIDNQTGGANSLSSSESGDSTGELDTSIYISGARNVGANQEYALKYQLHTFGGDGTVADNRRFYDTETLYNEKAVYHSETGSYAIWYDTTNYIISAISDIGGSPTVYYFSPVLEGPYTGVNEPDLICQSTLKYIQSSATSLQPIGPEEAEWWGVDEDDWRIRYDSGDTRWEIVKNSDSTVEANRPFYNLNSSEWYDGTYVRGPLPVNDADIDEYRWDLIVQIGRNPIASTTVTVTQTNSEELKFVSEGGTIPDPVAGQTINISNQPTDNGKFRTTVTITTVYAQRVPALFDSIVYASGSNPDKCALIVGRNATYEQFQNDVNTLYKQKFNLQNTVSVNINALGLYDYTVRSIEV